VPLEIENWEEAPQRDKKETVHNSSLEVNYSESAAQVLQLIEELQYRLKSRMQAIEALQRYYDDYNKIPVLNELEKVLSDITVDQIATHFDSYFGYLEAALTGQYEQEFFRTLCLDYAQKFYQENQIIPTFRAISLANQYNGLLACSEPEVKFLLGSESELENYLSGIDKTLESTKPIIVKPAEIATPVESIEINEESLLIEKYLSVIKTRQDLLKLSVEDRTEIKRVFNSEFRFFSCLQNKIKK
jgi:hypothetical protein